MESLFKSELKMALAGEAKITADFTDLLICVDKQGFCFFQFAAVNIVA